MSHDFEDIRPFHDEEVPSIILELLKEERFVKAVKHVLPEANLDELFENLKKLTTKDEFQTKMSAPMVWKLVNHSSAGVEGGGFEDLKHVGSCTFISNHRDIILDSAILSVMLLKYGFRGCEIAIGDNLLVFPWIENLVRINKSFIVKRSLSVRQMLTSSQKLSAYIHHTINEKKEMVWIAQREGRAKDSNDQTQESLIKMLSMGGERDFLNNIRSLNIVPLSLSYEYDPCDYLKAKEFQLKRDNPEYKKSQIEDLLNMETGIFGNKGRIHFQVGTQLNKKIAKTCDEQCKTDLLQIVVKAIDNEIHSCYKIFPGNYVALDLLEGNNRFSKSYSVDEKKIFEEYLAKQLNKIDIPNKDTDFLKTKILEMYANPLINKQIALGL
ncbi:MAG: 1-acyl-sn-glycerol-3-phosphate acyltransferase [Bacteroidales bacterium]|nr:1-acyl-sn-glycerol-3-phosphate acyltransferase [Bacteroidales bacterium]